MRSLIAASFLTSLLLGCVSTTNEEPAPLEQDLSEGPSSAVNEPCPAPLVTPASVPQKEGEPQAEASAQDASTAEEKGIAEGEHPTQFEESIPPPAGVDQQEAPPAEPRTAEDKPDVKSHIDVEAVPPEIPDRRDYFVTSQGLNVRSAPSAQSSVVRRLLQGEKVTSWGREGIWVQIAESEYVSIIYLSDRPTGAQASNTPK